ncbi:hypothetical protein [Erwinia sp. CGal63]|uniref:hypothetical protein n=1 Tax=Erwinia sp. CGal63 TaxID=2919889 RepID=UPI0030090EAD
MKKYSALICLLLSLSGCMGHHHHADPANSQSRPAECSSHSQEIDCSWNVPDNA